MNISFETMGSAELGSLEKQYYNHGIGHTQTISDICFMHAENDFLIDMDGKRYLDFNGTLNLPFGHTYANPVAALHECLPLNAVSYATRERLQLCLKLSELFPDYTAFQFYSAGTEANEGAIRYAIAVTCKDGFGAFRKSYHGRTRATVSLCNMKEYNGNRMQGYFRVNYPEHPQDSDRILAELDEQIGMDHLRSCAGIFIEPVLGKSVTIPPEGFLARLKKEICEKYGVLLIADEYLTSIRTGAWSACLAQGVKPDIMTIGKCLGNGIPFAVLMCHKSVAENVWRVKGSTTFGGNPIACSTVLKNIADIERQQLVTSAAKQIEQIFFAETDGIRQCDIVKDVRGKGALLGIEFPNRDICLEVSRRCVENGVLVSCIKNVVRVTPSLTISAETLCDGLQKICDAIRQTDKCCTLEKKGEEA